MYELVIDYNGDEYVAFSAEKKREVDLVAQRHVRSLASGLAVVREAKKKVKK